MPTANSFASNEVVTAALPVVGGKILSGRTKGQNIGYIAEYLTAVGIDLKEVRMVGNEESAIVDALNALRHSCTYVFTAGGIGPTHGDITPITITLPVHTAGNVNFETRPSVAPMSDCPDRMPVIRRAVPLVARPLASFSETSRSAADRSRYR